MVGARKRTTRSDVAIGPDLPAAVAALRPDQPIEAVRWVEFEEDPTLSEGLGFLKKRRYERRARFVLRVAAVLIIAAVTYLWTNSTLLSWAGMIAMGLYVFTSRTVELGSAMIFYRDKIVILADVRFESRTKTYSYGYRTDVTPGSVTPAFKLAGLNPFWRLHHLSLKLRGKRVLVGRPSGIAVRRRRHLRLVPGLDEITLGEAKARLLRFVA